MFSQMKPEKEHEWRNEFGSEEARKLREEEAAMKASKKAARKAGSIAKDERDG